MSRSVGNLRTSLIDAGLGKPVFALLKYPDNAVQIAATDVSINLVLDFSPMREVSLPFSVCFGDMQTYNFRTSSMQESSRSSANMHEDLAPSFVKSRYGV